MSRMDAELLEVDAMPGRYDLVTSTRKAGKDGATGRTLTARATSARTMSAAFSRRPPPRSILRTKVNGFQQAQPEEARCAYFMTLIVATAPSPERCARIFEKRRCAIRARRRMKAALPFERYGAAARSMRRRCGGE